MTNGCKSDDSSSGTVSSTSSSSSSSLSSSLLRSSLLNSRPIYARATSHVCPAPTVETQMRLTAAGNFYQTADISNNYLHLSLSELLVAERQRIGRANYSRNFCHTHCQQVSHNVNQCRSEDIRRRPRQ
mmetsp:Transcript_9008/g.10542  ORF Transcript_9008/g.10542 Transcript_9008/m.10542 type:complete len:129 (-) Transcript_9008:97-483(-)